MNEGIIDESISVKFLRKTPDMSNYTVCNTKQYKLAAR